MPEERFYSDPELCTYDHDLSRSWFVWFDIKDPSTGILHRKQFRGGINYYKDFKGRYMRLLLQECAEKRNWSNHAYN